MLAQVIPNKQESSMKRKKVLVKITSRPEIRAPKETRQATLILTYSNPEGNQVSLSASVSKSHDQN